MVNVKQDLNKKDEKYVWHSMRKFDPEATMVVTEADGAWITDAEGNRYLDGMAGLWSVNVGYGRTELAEAAYNQLKKLPFYPLTHSHQPAIELGEKLNEWLEDDYVIFFSNSGSEANEVAFKIARQYHRQNGDYDRYKIISRYRSYHGNTIGALAATGQALRKYKYEPLAQGFLHVAPPDCYRSSFDSSDGTCCSQSASEIDRVMTWELDETIAAVIMEPIITGGGVLIPHDHYLKEVEEICSQHGALLIVDEVINGFGRTGKRFGHMHAGIKPDIVTMAKGLTSSYMPLSATAVKREIYEAFKGTEEYDHFRHINTFGGSPASCAVALKNIEIMEREGLVERSAVLGKRLNEGLMELIDHPNVGDIRSRGLLLGIELVEDKATKKPAHPDKLTNVISFCKRKGLIIGKNGDTVKGFNNVLTLSPPLNLTEDDLELIIKTVKEAIIQI
ncbi:aminotransferase class III-fold pyridoxal phosphate-dependent enzyme [Aquibacillus halophilus]|uniref:Aminotransferase class III-fold pyridoxal phosphate-dependent enzyme n=1 Tax=Aquibacillus halophilus TaxID=930132 RepID=A0A6A8D8Y6_9BACI|nr:aspartate aminotransferase family protein [Aquibacillus halophilus]MRH41720.1 aminotransferase class III-fold pyridoxal phosphate-dependent enzyme [Aquibacillus halophilus]